MTRHHTQPDLSTLVDMLSFKRPHGSKAEKAFVRRFVAPTGAQPDDFGNYILRIGTAPVLWSCHTDSAHKRGDSGRHRTVVAGGTIALAPDETSGCLGADDAAGCWLLLEMIAAGVPGLYVFHRAEEVGGLGSSHIAEQTPELLDGIRYAIAFDRRGTRSVITHQMRGRCCSDRFAVALGAQLGPDFQPDPGGTFTDTASYVDLVPECTNVSVGYQHEHTQRETLDLDHVVALRASLLSLDVSALPCERQPGMRDYDDIAEWWEPQRGRGFSGRRMSLEELVAEYPEVAAAMLEGHGIGVDAFESEVAEWYSYRQH